jgi:hypothetical protein
VVPKFSWGVPKVLPNISGRVPKFSGGVPKVLPKFRGESLMRSVAEVAPKLVGGCPRVRAGSRRAKFVENF